MRAADRRRPEGTGRAFTFPRTFLAESGPRAIADAILDEYVRGCGTGLASQVIRQPLAQRQIS